MQLDVATATVPKAGHTAAENEDAAALAAGRAAVADGATEGWQSGPWARALAAAYVEAPPSPATFAAWLAACRTAFQRSQPPVAAAWYAEAKAEQGAFATLLGLDVRLSEKGPAWRAVAVGDCCLFRVGSGNLLEVFPVEGADDFGTRPELVASAGPPPAAQWLAGRADPGDAIYLLTDALAEWFLKNSAAAPWQDLDAALAGDFSGWVAGLRTARMVKNDDATALRVRVPRPGVPP